MASQTVDCKSDLSPSTLGKPSVSDNKGSNTILTHQDLPASSCSFQRKWTATDQAINSASKIQDINLINLRPRQWIAKVMSPLLAGALSNNNKICGYHQCPSSVRLADQDNTRRFCSIKNNSNLLSKRVIYNEKLIWSTIRVIFLRIDKITYWFNYY